MSHELDVALVDELTAAVVARDAADAKVLDLLVKARAMTPPVPLAALAKACEISVSAVSVRLSRHAARNQEEPC